MKAQTLRRVLIYGTGVLIGGMIVLLLNKSKEERPSERRVNRTVVSMSTCDMKKGDHLKEGCIESRAVEEQFIPPGTMAYKRRKLFIGQPLLADIPVGAAIREVDIEAMK